MQLPDVRGGYTFYFVSGGQTEYERVQRQCIRENGGRLVGNPSVPKELTGVETDRHDGLVTGVIIEDRADPGNWWEQYCRVHDPRLKP